MTPSDIFCLVSFVLLLSGEDTMSSEKRFTDIIAFGERLAQARTRLKLSQETLAEAVGATARSISRWEHNQATPQPYYLERLCAVLQITPETLCGLDETEQKDSAFSEVTPLWHVPYTRNPYFIGREAILRQLYERLHTEKQVTLTQPQIVSGLGGIGKTQTALEYAYRYRHNYQAVLWVGAETKETLMADYLALAQLFQLPEKDNLNHSFVIGDVKRWFQNHSDWLLIFDNVEDLDLLQRMLPDSSQGHILITTRSQIIGTLGSQLALQKMEPAEGVLLLLRRARLLRADEPLETVPASVREQAGELVELLDGLPLALDQAAAYIEETTCSLPGYLERYAMWRKDLLGMRGTPSSHHPASVTTTLSLAVEQVEQASPMAVELLRLCAFLHAEAIPEEFFTLSAESLGPELQSLSSNPLPFDAVMKELRRFSLIHREPETRTLNIHRLLQAIIQDRMDEHDRKQRMERLILAMLQIFPVYDASLFDDSKLQSLCQRHLLHVLLCTTYIKEWGIISLEAAELLHRVGDYLAHVCGDYAQALPLLHQALYLAEKILGREQETVASYLYGLAYLYSNVGQLTQAEEYFRQALAIREKLKGLDDPEVAQTLWSLAGLFCHQGMYRRAVSLATRALKINEQAFGPHHYKVAQPLNVLGWSYTRLGEYTQAEPLLQRAISMYTQALGEEHPLNVACLSNLAYLYSLQGYPTKAVALHQKALRICELQLRPQHTLTAIILNRLGNAYFAQRQYDHAEACHQKSAKIFEKIPESGSFYAAYPLLDLGELYQCQGRLSLAKHYLQRAFTILGESFQIDHINQQEMARCLLLAGDQLIARGEFMGAQTYYQRAFALGSQTLGSDHPLTLRCSSNLEKISALMDTE